MQFTNPIWLWGLTGLMIPIAVHLLSRKEGKVIKIGSIRHLEASNTKQSISLRLNELLLLAMRCLLIVLLVLLLCGPHFRHDQRKSEQWVIVESGLENDLGFVPLIDSLQRQGFQLKRLAEGFPPLTDSKTNTQMHYWKLMEALKNKSLNQTVVLAYNYASGFSGKRISMPNNLTWISKNPSPAEFSLQTVKFSADSVFIRNGYTTPDETAFNNLTAPLNPKQPYIKSSSGNNSTLIAVPDTLIINVVSDLEFSNDKNILLAALQAIEKTVTTIFTIKVLPRESWKPEEKTDWTIWLSNSVAIEPAQCNSIIFAESIVENQHLFEQEKANFPERTTWLLTKRLNEEVALQEKLPLKLISILLPKKELERRAAEFDRRVQPEKMLWSPEGQSGQKVLAATGPNVVAQILAILTLLALFLERFIAFQRNQ